MDPGCSPNECIGESTIDRHLFKIPSDQLELLDRNESWAHILGRHPRGFINVPPEVLENLKISHATRQSEKLSESVNDQQIDDVSRHASKRRKSSSRGQSDQSGCEESQQDSESDDGNNDNDAESKMSSSWAPSPEHHLYPPEKTTPEAPKNQFVTQISRNSPVPPTIRSSPRPLLGPKQKNALFNEFPSSSPAAEDDLEIEVPAALERRKSQSTTILPVAKVAQDMSATPPSAQVVPCTFDQSDPTAMKPRQRVYNKPQLYWPGRPAVSTTRMGIGGALWGHGHVALVDSQKPSSSSNTSSSIIPATYQSQANLSQSNDAALPPEPAMRTKMSSNEESADNAQAHHKSTSPEKASPYPEYRPTSPDLKGVILTEMSSDEGPADNVSVHHEFTSPGKAPPYPEYRPTSPDLSDFPPPESAVFTKMSSNEGPADNSQAHHKHTSLEKTPPFPEYRSTSPDLSGFLPNSLKPQTEPPAPAAAMQVTIPADPFRRYKRTYSSYSGEIADFIQACVYIQIVDWKIRTSLFDDFIRAWMEDYKPYVEDCDNADPRVKATNAIKWYNAIDDNPLYTSRIVTKQNLLSILDSYPDEHESARRYIGLPPLPKLELPKPAGIFAPGVPESAPWVLPWSRAPTTEAVHCLSTSGRAAQPSGSTSSKRSAARSPNIPTITTLEKVPRTLPWAETPGTEVEHSRRNSRVPERRTLPWTTTQPSGSKPSDRDTTPAVPFDRSTSDATTNRPPHIDDPTRSQSETAASRRRKAEVIDLTDDAPRRPHKKTARSFTAASDAKSVTSLLSERSRETTYDSTMPTSTAGRYRKSMRYADDPKGYERAWRRHLIRSKSRPGSSIASSAPMPDRQL